MREPRPEQGPSGPGSSNLLATTGTCRVPAISLVGSPCEARQLARLAGQARVLSVWRLASARGASQPADLIRRRPSQTRHPRPRWQRWLEPLSDWTPRNYPTGLTSHPPDQVTLGQAEVLRGLR